MANERGTDLRRGHVARRLVPRRPPALGDTETTMSSNRQNVFPTRMALTTLKQKQLGAMKGECAALDMA